VADDFHSAKSGHVFEEAAKVVLGIGSRYAFVHSAILAKIAQSATDRALPAE
jgi:hypothetical protein